MGWEASWEATVQLGSQDTASAGCCELGDVLCPSNQDKLGTEK